MKSLLKGALFIALIGTIIVGCKEETTEPTIDNSTQVVSEKDNKKQKTMTMEDYFASLNVGDNLYANKLSGVLDVNIIIGEGPNNPVEAKFPDDFWGRKEAAVYANDIMDDGGCVKAWKDGGYIYVEEVNC